MIDPRVKSLLGDAEKYSPEAQAQILSLLIKMISLGFMASFKKLEEGPIVRTYFFEPAASTKLSDITSKEDDLALALKVESIMIRRILGYITIAVPRIDRQVIKFDKALMTLLQSTETSSMTLPILMGQTPTGKDFYLDLASQPHILIAGSTNSGKSIFVSQLICSLALFHGPDELKFTLVDTKQLDLTLFSGLPHIGNVVTDIHELRETLKHLLDLVRKRTSMMSGLYRNISEYNADTMNVAHKMKYEILIIDEFADVLDSDKEYTSSLMPKVRPVSIADLVKRLAQISRAAGVHIVIATQRPSVKIVSGDIKTNFPCRICFKLPSMHDSRVVLDENGAEALLGRGDYLYKTATSETTTRAHSAFVSVHDIANIIMQSEFLRLQYLKK